VNNLEWLVPLCTLGYQARIAPQLRFRLTTRSPLPVREAVMNTVDERVAWS